MRNENPVPVTCALCGSRYKKFDHDRSWVYAGMAQLPYLICVTCLNERNPSVTVDTSGRAIFIGDSTPADLEARVEALERKLA